MDPLAPRRFTLFDAMSLVAATAVGLALSRSYLALVRPSASSRMIPASAPSSDTILWFAQFWIAAGSVIVASWSLAILALSLRRPRPPLRRWACRPGIAACVATLAALAVQYVPMLPTLVLGPPISFDAPQHTPSVLFSFWITKLPVRIAPAVASAWLILGLVGRWRPSPSWIDRAGRILGAIWIVSGIVLAFLRQAAL